MDAIPSATDPHPSLTDKSSLIPESDFALVIAFESKFVNGEIIILSVPASFIDGNAILYACVTSPLDVSTAPTGTSTTIGLFARH